MNHYIDLAISKISNLNIINLAFSMAGVFIFIAACIWGYISHAKFYNKKVTLWDFIRYSAPIKQWVGVSSRIDLFLYVLNRATGHLVFIGNMVLAVFLAKYVSAGFTLLLGFNQGYSIGLVGLIICYLIAVMPRDFARYGMHWMQHVIPTLWEFHKVHHSAQFLTPLTSARSHPVQDQLDVVAEGVALALSFGLIDYIYKVSEADLFLIAATSWMIIHYAVLSPMQHSHVFISFGVFDKVFFSPAMHHIHHSSEERHWDKNFGNSLSIWDRLFRTYYNPVRGESITYGLDGNKHKLYESVVNCYILPFKNVYALAAGSLKSKQRAIETDQGALGNIP